MFRGDIHSHTKLLLITIYITLKEMDESEKDEKLYLISYITVLLPIIYTKKVVLNPPF